MDNIVVSSRVRLARNLSTVPFPNRQTVSNATELSDKVLPLVNSLETYTNYQMSKISPIDAKILQEKHLISDDLINNAKFGSALINKNQQISIMLNEEDHIRMQCILPHFSLNQAFTCISKIDDLISSNLPIAYDNNLGYLTSCITNVGTGMRASALMFLPGLALTESISEKLTAVSNFKISIRGAYGEGSKAEGFLYQISNQRSLGLSESEIIASVTATINHLIDAENLARDYLYSKNEIKLRDQIGRAYGALTNSYVLSTSEFMQLIAFVKLGCALEIIKIKNPIVLDKLIIDCQPANLVFLSGKNLDAIQRDIFRASYVAETLKKN